MKQSRPMSLVESVANVIVGYVLAIVTQIVVFPWFGIETGLAEHLSIGLAFCRGVAGAWLSAAAVVRAMATQLTPLEVPCDRC
jgi:hypothetical protein